MNKTGKKVTFCALLLFTLNSRVQAMESEQTCSWNDLPTELKLHILSFLPAHKDKLSTFFEYGLTSKDFQRHINLCPFAKEIESYNIKNEVLGTKFHVTFDGKQCKQSEIPIMAKTVASIVQAAANNQHWHIVRSLIERIKNESPKWCMCNGAIVQAVIHGNLETVKFLIKSGAQVNTTDAVGRSILWLAVHFQHKKIVKCLLKNKASVNGNYQWVPLIAACQKNDNDIEIINLLLARAADVNAVDARNNTPLLAAVKSGNLLAMNVLVGNGADVNRGNKLETPLTAAIKLGNSDVVSLLLNSGANIEKSALLGTPLTCAIRHGNISLVKLLLDRGAEPHIEDLKLATESFLEIAELLNGLISTGRLRVL